MSKNIYSIITGTGSYIPSKVIKNKDFLTNEFYDKDGVKLSKPNPEIIKRFEEITTISERRYADDDITTSDMSHFAAQKAIKSAGIDQEDLDYIIVAHNFGELKNGNKQIDIVPCLAARVKYKLKIKNPYTVAYDLPFGCPGWLQGVIQADYFIKSGDANKVLIIGADILSRICDPHDMDSMIYSDGAGAVIMEGTTSEEPTGILAHKTRSDTFVYSQMLSMGKSYKPDRQNENDLYLKMNGRKLYQYALQTVPQAIKACLEKSNLCIKDVSKILIHQANGKMDDAIMKRLYDLYDDIEMPDDIMPMTIATLGNSSVATIPTLLDLILKGQLEHHAINKGDTIVFASVGAGMNINAAVYKV